MSLAKQTAQSVVLSASSNVLAQALSAYRNDQPLTLNPAPILKFAAFAIINTPPNVLWQSWLERQFPSHEPVPASEISSSSSSSPPSANSYSSEKPPQKPFLSSPQQTRKSTRNTLSKFLLDQTAGALLNTLLFFTAMGCLNGDSPAAIMQTIREQGVDLWLAGLKLWPAVSLISFWGVGVEQRVLFGSLAGVVWGVWLSLLEEGRGGGGGKKEG